MEKSKLEQAAVKEVEAYQFFNPRLRENDYAFGDIYSKKDIAEAQEQWAIPSGPNERPYLTHIKSLSAAWPHLRLLADFMEVSTSPKRWRDFQTGKRSQSERDERAKRTNVTRLDYLASGKVEPQEYTTSEELKKALEGEAQEKNADQRKFRLFVVEDLSRDVIELLGAHLDIEPAFFREHIFDYVWYNTRDRWVDPPRLSIATKRQRWVQFRFATARYFKTTESFKKGCDEAESFNVLRRPEDDENNKALWDEKGAIVGLSRTRTSFWLKSSESNAAGVVGVLLVDPTIKEGVPLWYGYRNWEETPSIKEKQTPVGPPRASLYADLIYWAQKGGAFQQSPTANPAANIHIPIQALLHLICAEWLTMSDYMRTRLGQIEWEISYPNHFLNKGSNIDVALKKLHIWRRLVPLYREMINETLQRAFEFQCHPTHMASVPSGLGSMSNNDAGNGNGSNQHTSCQCPLHDPAASKQGPVNALREDFVRVLTYLEDFQQRIDRLTSVVTAIISIADSRRSQDDNRNVARLTWLATFFIPLSFVASLFSMQSDITALDDTIKWYFAAALPVAVLSLGFALVLTLPAVQKFGDVVIQKLKFKK